MQYCEKRWKRWRQEVQVNYFELTAIPANLAKAFYICLNLQIMKSKGASERTNIAKEPIEFEIHLE